MNDAYTATVRQLLDIAPVVFESPHFAIKGGTALNLFLHDLPRLSVDIDVVFTDHTLDRATALQAISSELRVISQKLEAMGYEVLKPRLHPLEATFANQFDGMTRAEISLVTLEQTRERLVQDLPRALTDQHRTFLLSLVQNEPRWDCMPFAHLQELPAIRWKLQNLAKLKGAKRAQQVERLEACFQQEGRPL